MPSLIDIRRRIRSVRNTQQITKAMKMVSAARLRRAQDRVLAARPYSQTLTKMLAGVASAAAAADGGDAHPLLVRRPEKRIQMIVIASDRGLAGAFNSNLLKLAGRFITEEKREADIEVEAVGRKTMDYFRKRPYRITGEHTGFGQGVPVTEAQAIARRVIDRYTRGEIDAVYLFVNEFKSVLAPNLTQKRILPIDVPQDAAPVDYIYEQPPAELLGALLPKYVETQIYRALLESNAAEHAARMTAMDAATSNARDLIDKLTLYMNRVRQATITREIIEIVSGASALE
jgi:F-type H+-transporting ATPase subunit gamma